MIFVLMLLTLMKSYSVKLFHNMGIRRTTLSLSTVGLSEHDTGDVLLTGMNLDQDISVKVISCKEIIQESIMRNNLSPQAAKALGEVMTCSLMMGSGLKDQETLQVNLVGTAGIKNVMVITDGDLKCRGMVGNSQIALSEDDSEYTRNLFGEGQVQVVRNHPTWNQPSNGITNLRDIKIPLNLALYMSESEQRPCVLLADVRVEGSLCRHALGIMMERLPGATEENIERSIRNLEVVEKKGLRSYLDRTETERKLDPNDTGMFRDFAPVLGQVLDDCFVDMGESFRFVKTPRYRCSCSVDRIWRTLRLLPKDELQEIIDAEENVEMKCEFCGTKYNVTRSEVIEKIFNS